MATISGAAYPPQWIDALIRQNISLSQLPVLNLKGRIGETDYIDFLGKPDMISSLMQFTDKYGRKGLAFRLRGKVDVLATVGEYRNFSAMPIRELHTIRAVFQNGDQWLHADGEKWPEHFTFELIYRAAHAPDHKAAKWADCEACPTLPFSTNQNIQWACDIINGTDPVWTLDGEIEQVRDAEMPGLVLDAMIVEPESF